MDLSLPLDSDRIADYEMKLMDIDADQLGIPDTEYDARVTMSSTELSRIVKDLAQLGESVRIDVSKDGVRFEADGESANGKVLLRQTEAARRRYAEDENEEGVKKDDDDDDEKEEGGSGGKRKRAVKKEKKANGVKKEGEDAEMEDGEKEGEDESGEFKAESDEEGEEEKEEASDEEQENRKKRKKAQAKVRCPTFYPSALTNQGRPFVGVNG